MKWMKFVIIFIVLAAVGTIFFFNYKKEQARLMQEELAALRKAQDAAARLHVAIKVAVTNITAAETLAMDYAEKATNTVPLVTGKPFPRHPKKIYMPVHSSPTTAADGSATPAAKSDPDVSEKESKDEMPAGMLSREQLEQLRQGAMAKRGEKPKEKKEEDTSKEKTPSSGKIKLRIPKTEPEPDIVIIARRVVFESESITEKARTARAIAVTSLQLAATAAAADNSATARKYGAALLEKYRIIDTLKKETDEALFQLEDPYRKVLSLKEKIEKEREQRQLAEERRRKAIALQKLTEEETGAIGNIRLECQDIIKNYKYAQAVEKLKAKLPDIQTDKGREHLNILIDRYTRLQGLHAFVVKRINVKKFRWGWGQGPSAKDILAANDDHVKITGKTMPWTAADPPQMMKIIKYYVEDTDVDRKIRAEQELALAIFYYEHGQDNRAQSLAQDIVKNYPTLTKQTQRLLPF